MYSTDINGGLRHKRLKARGPADSASTYGEEITARRTAGVDAVAMRRVRVRAENVARIEQAAAVHETQVLGALEVAEEVLDGLPVRLARIGNEARQESDRIGDIRPSAARQIEQRANRLAIRHCAHRLDLLVRLRALGLG